MRDATNRRMPSGVSAGSASKSGSPFKDSGKDLRGGAPAKGSPAREHLVEHAPEGPHVGARDRRARRAPARGSCRPRVPSNRARVGRSRGRRVAAGGASCRSSIRRLREAEVEHLDDAVGPDHDVGGLQVAMDDALLVSGLERVGDLPRDRQHLGQRQTSSASAAPRSSAVAPPVSPLRRVPGRARGCRVRARRRESWRCWDG